MRTKSFHQPMKEYASHKHRRSHGFVNFGNGVLILASLVFLALASACGNGADAPDAIPVEEKSDTGNLAQLVTQLKAGMSRTQVLELLGEPTWAAIPGDRGDYRIREEGIKLILYWRNPGAPPVMVTFDEAYSTVKWTDGLPKKGTYEQIFEPYDSYLCSLPDREEFCK